MTFVLCSLTESQLPRRPDSQLKLQRKGSDGAAKKHRVNAGNPSSAAQGATPPVTIESGSSSLPRNIPKGILSSGSGLSAPTNYHDPSSKLSDLESSGSSSSSHSTAESAKQSSLISVKKSPSMKKAASASGLRMPSGKTGLTRPSETPSSMPVKEEEPSPAPSATASKLIGPLKKMTSASSLPIPPSGSGSGSPASKQKLSRLAGPASTSKLHSFKPHPHVASLSVSKATGSTSSLESCNSDIIKVGVSQKIDRESANVEPEFDKSSDVSVEQESDPTPSRPPPKSLEIDKSALKDSDIVSPPAEFKMLEKRSPRDTRRISPEGMSQEDSNNRPSETPPKLSGDDTQKEEPSSLTESVERNLKNERESGGDSSSLVIQLSTEEGEKVGEEKKIVNSQPAVMESNLSSGNTKNEEDLKPKSKGFSQPETGQPAMDSPQLVQKISSDAKMATSEESDETGGQQRLSRESEPRSHEQGKPRARSLSPKATHRVGTVSIGPAYLPPHMVPLTQGLEFSRTASSDGGRERKPLKSVLRHSNSSTGVARNNSSSSFDGVPGKSKVTISPRSSQVRPGSEVNLLYS